MIDWFALFTNLMYYIQWLASICFFSVIGTAFIGFFVNKKITLECIFIAIIMSIIDLILNSQGIQLLAPELFSLF
jgi:hypothetical protein